MRRLFTLVIYLCLASSVFAHYEPYEPWTEDYNVQSLLGVVQFDELLFKVADSDTPRNADLTTLPQLGGAWSTLPLGDRLQVGLECSLLIGFKVDRLNYIYAGSGTLSINLKTSLWTFDLAGGPYANLYLDNNRRVRVYAAGGPLLAYIDYDADRRYSDDTPREDRHETAFGAGVYARTGIEFRVNEQGMLGVGARGSWTSIDLTDVGGSTELTGVAAFVTYSLGF